MKKIPTMFERVFDGHKIVAVTHHFTNDLCEKALEFGTPTIKYDGSPIFCGKLGIWKRIDLGKAKNFPYDKPVILCEKKPDEVTGHWPAWILLDRSSPADKWFLEAYKEYWKQLPVKAGTYEAIGPHFQGNPYKLPADTLVKHGDHIADDLKERSFAGVKHWLETHGHEGLVFWLSGKPVCKIKRTDFGLPWPYL